MLYNDKNITDQHRYANMQHCHAKGMRGGQTDLYIRSHVSERLLKRRLKWSLTLFKKPNDALCNFDELFQRCHVAMKFTLISSNNALLCLSIFFETLTTKSQETFTYSWNERCNCLRLTLVTRAVTIVYSIMFSLELNNFLIPNAVFYPTTNISLQNTLNSVIIETQLHHFKSHYSEI